MTKQLVNIGTTDDDGTGDELRDGFDKINNNINEIYNAATPIPDKTTLEANSTKVGSAITLNVGAYVMGIIDLITDTLTVQAGTVLIGTTSSLSSVTTNSSLATITVISGAGSSSLFGMGGFKINNTGTGAAVRAAPNSVLFTQNLFTSAAGNGLELDGAGGFGLRGWTFTSGVTNGCVMTGTNPRTVMALFNPADVTGIGLDIQGPMSGSLLLASPIIESVGIGIRCNQAIQGIGISDGLVSSAGAKGIEFTGSTVGAIRATGSRIAGNTAGTAASGNGHAFDIQGANTVSSLTIDDSNMFTRGSGNACFATDADSATNIGLRGDFSTTSFVPIIGGTALLNATKKDISLVFVGCFGSTPAVSTEVASSIVLGCFTLDSQATTTIGFQGDHNGAITAMADSAANPGTHTTVTSAGHGMGNGEPVAQFGTTSYNGLFTTSATTANDYDIERPFVANDATGNFESGWVKIAGSTTDCPTIERFNGSADNEQEYLAGATVSLTYNANIAGQKSGAAVQLYEFALFCDSGVGDGFVKINGSVPHDFTNRASSTSLRIPTEAAQGEKFTSFVRNVDGTVDFICDALTSDIGVS